MLHVGTLGLVMEPTALALQAVVEAVADRALIMVDPNCRPTFIGDRGTYRRSLAATLRYAHVVKVSNDDLEYLEPGASPVDAARTLLEDGPRIALLTLGGDGAMIVTADTTETVPAPVIEVVDTIGAGDAFGGGFLAWWQLRGLDRDALGDPDAVRAATTFACVVAARTCERAGASPPRLSELDGEL
jgi:fructokinase